MNRKFGILATLLFLSCQAEPTVPEAPVPTGTPAARTAVRPQGFPADMPYSPGMLADKTLHIAGQLGRDPISGAQPANVGEQTHQAMRNIGSILQSAGMDYANLVTCNVYLASMDDYAAMNRAYGSYFQERVPTRTTIEPGGLPREAGVEISCVAYRDAEMIEVIRPAEGKLPKPLGPYSPSIKAGNLLYLSGMGGQDPATGTAANDFEAQVRQTLTNISETLRAAGLSPGDVIHANVFITEAEGFAIVDRVFEEMGIAAPRGTYLVRRLPGGIKAEITFTAADRTAGGPLPVYALAAVDDEPTGGGEPSFRTAFQNLRQQLSRTGLDLSDVVAVFVYLQDMRDFQALNAAYREAFPADPPARATLQVVATGDGNGRRGEIAVTAAPVSR